MFLFFKKVLFFIFEALFPDMCAICGKIGFFLCDVCACSVRIHSVHLMKKRDSRLCFLRNLSALAFFEKRHVFADLIHEFKYRNREVVHSSYFDPLLYAFFLKEQEYFSDIDCITYVPLHKIRENERGFNQAERVAHSVGTVLKKPLVSLLKRSKKTKQQALIRDGSLRKQNVLNAFFCIDFSACAGKKVLIVDDVFTTGSTMEACAQALVSGGAISVSGFVLLVKKHYSDKF